MRNRSVAAATGMLAVLVPLLVVLPSPAHAAPVGTDSLTPEPHAAVANGDVLVRGSCAGVSDGVDSSFPTRTDLRLDGLLLEGEVPVQSGGFGPVRVTVPNSLEPGEHELTSDCGQSEPVVAVPFTVLDAPLLTIAPEQVDPGGEVTATGTCSIGVVELLARPVELLLDEERVLGTATLNTSTGVLELATVQVPEDVEPGSHTVTSDCGGSDDLTLLAPSEPPTGETTPAEPSPGETTPAETTPAEPSPGETTPAEPSPGETTPPQSSPAGPTDVPPDLVTVPNLLDLTREQALVALGNDLVLRVVTGADGRITGQSPQPGVLVTRGSTVGVDLAGGEGGSWVPILVALAIAAVVASTFGGRSVLRPRRERRWLDRHVQALPEPGPWNLPPGPDGVVVPSIDMSIEVRRDPARLEFQEVGHARD